MRDNLGDRREKPMVKSPKNFDEYLRLDGYSVGYSAISAFLADPQCLTA